MHPTLPVEGASLMVTSPTATTGMRKRARATQAERRGRRLLSWWASAGAAAALALVLSWTPGVRGDCWLIEGEKGFVWLAICSQNQPPFEAIPLHINSTIVDLRLNENKIRGVFYASLSRFSNLTYLNLTKNDIAYVEDGAFSALFNLQVHTHTHTHTLTHACTHFVHSPTYPSMPLFAAKLFASK